MRRSKDFLPDVLLPLEPGGERRCWHGVGSLPVTTRVSERLADMLILASGIEADLQSEEGAHLRWIAGDVERVRESIEALLQRLVS